MLPDGPAIKAGAAIGPARAAGPTAGPASTAPEKYNTSFIKQAATTAAAGF